MPARWRATCFAWDKAQQWIADGKPGVNDKLPLGAKWVTEEMYELDGDITSAIGRVTTDRSPVVTRLMEPKKGWVGHQKLAN